MSIIIIAQLQNYTRVRRRQMEGKRGGGEEEAI